MEPKSSLNRSRGCLGGVWEGLAKSDENRVPNGGQMGAKMDPKLKPKSSKKRVRNQGRSQEGSRGAPGSPLGPFWEPFYVILGTFWETILMLSQTDRQTDRQAGRQTDTLWVYHFAKWRCSCMLWHKGPGLDNTE